MIEGLKFCSIILGLIHFVLGLEFLLIVLTSIKESKEGALSYSIISLILGIIFLCGAYFLEKTEKNIK